MMINMLEANLSAAGLGTIVLDDLNQIHSLLLVKPVTTSGTHIVSKISHSSTLRLLANSWEAVGPK